MSATFKTQAGQVVNDGEVVELTLRHGDGEKTVYGTVRAFEPHTEEIALLEAKLAQLRADGDLRWELMMDDPQHPAIGFLPEHALTSSTG